jgi:cobalt-zinc-cadmium efflux system membrane fusion protein
MNAEIEVPGHEAIVAPEEAVVHYEGKDHVFIPSGAGTFELIEVETGDNTNGMVEILPGKNINGSSQIVIKGAYTLLSSLKNRSE